jgi:chromate transporter
MASLCAPSSALTFFTAQIWERFRHAPWRRTVQQGLLPVTAGLITASGILVAKTTSSDWGTGAVTAAGTLLFLTTRVNPLLVLAVAAVLGAAGLLD